MTTRDDRKRPPPSDRGRDPSSWKGTKRPDYKAPQPLTQGLSLGEPSSPKGVARAVETALHRLAARASGELRRIGRFFDAEGYYTDDRPVAAGGGGGAPSAHASTHENGGSDEINVAGLSGRLADDQPFDLDDVGSTQGQILYRGPTVWVPLNPGTAGHLLATQGAGANPQWVDKATILLSPDGEYHPDIPPDSMVFSESWPGDVAENTWAWANQGTATETIERDGAVINNPHNLRSHAVRYAGALPSTGDFSAFAKISGGPRVDATLGGTHGWASLIAATNGEIDDPSEFHSIGINMNSHTTFWNINALRGTLLGSAYSHATAIGSLHPTSDTPVYLGLQWDDSASGTARLRHLVSFGGKKFLILPAAVGTLNGRPTTDLGYSASAGTTRVDWIRVFDSLTTEVGNRP